MKVKIISVRNFDGSEKDNRIWGSERYLYSNPPKVNECILLAYDTNFDRFRRTSLLKNIKDIGNHQKDYYTCNSIYRLEEL